MARPPNSDLALTQLERVFAVLLHHGLRGLGREHRAHDLVAPLARLETTHDAYFAHLARHLHKMRRAWDPQLLKLGEDALEGRSGWRSGGRVVLGEEADEMVDVF